jgi:hypothetical protein
MPNWCSNYVEIGHEDPQKIAALAEAMNSGGFLNHISPVPKDLTETMSGSFGDEVQQAALERKTAENLEKFGYGNWYDFCVNEWGTKWDVTIEAGVDVNPNGQNLVASFESAWSPPTRVYDAMVEQGYSVKAYYFESGMGFAGIYEDGSDDCYSDWGDSRGAKATLPQELDDFFAISESQAEYEDENEELTEWIKDGVEARKEPQE